MKVKPIMILITCSLLFLVSCNKNINQYSNGKQLVNQESFHLEDIHVDIGGSVEKLKGNQYVLNLAIEGTNDTSYDINEKDELYIAVHLPETVQVDSSALKGNKIPVQDNWVGLRIVGPKGEQFMHEYTIPLINKPANSDCQSVEKRFAYVNDKNELETTGPSLPKGEDQIVFTAQVSREIAAEIAIEKYGGHVVSMEEDRRKNDKLYYIAEIEKDKNNHFEVEIDAETGETSSINLPSD